MESESLRTASLYINNLLLARGLLRNGQNIDFARPQKGEGGMDATMGRIMTVINDLVLRRDRDAAQRESLSQTIRALRADALRQTADLERLQTKYTEAQRKLGSADAAERSFKAQIRSAEQTAKSLREEMARLKALVNQTRSQCANDVRKRERTIEGLKRHVGEGGRPRGTHKSAGFATITVTPGVGDDEKAKNSLSTNDAAYDLRMETNEFLSDLARGLSEENENLGSLVKRTVETLQAISGCEKLSHQDRGMIVDMEHSYDALALELDEVLEHLRNLLTNPSFVPLEEVEVREEEIMRLREGWEKMEGRWKEAVMMMDGWRKRMARSGQSVDLEELKMGLALSPVRFTDINGVAEHGLDNIEEEDEDGETQADIDALDDSQITGESLSEVDEQSDDGASILDEEPPEIEEEPELEAEPADYQQEIPFSSSTSSLGPLPQLTPLKETRNALNRGGFTTIIEESTWDLSNQNLKSPAKQSPEKRPTNQTPPAVIEAPLVTYPELTEENRPRFSPPKKRTQPGTPKPMLKEPTGSSRLPRPAPNQAQQSPLTMASIAAKLAATEREADAARVRAKLKAAKLSAKASAPSLKPAPSNAEAKAGADEPVKQEPESRKRKATGKPGGRRASRRRSTLSPWELESLITGGIDDSPMKGVAA